ncbi:PDZ domain-containing protein [Pirellulaceae bacterium]|nr:PDZ domain-containing protein [Pirellulaceae bacterium]
MLSRYFVFIAVVTTCSFAFGQEKSGDEKQESPRLFRGGLIKRFENLQEKLQKEREERQKQREKDEEDRPEELRKVAETKKSSQSQGNKRGFSSTRSISDQDFPQRFNPDFDRRLQPMAEDKESADEAPTQDFVSQKKTSQQMSLGIEVDPGRIGASGLSIETIDPKGPAALAGMVKGDRIISVGSSPIKTIEDLQMILEAFEPGDRTEIEYVRRSKKEKTLVEFPAIRSDPRSSLGLNSPAMQQGAEQLPAPNSLSNGTGLNAPLGPEAANPSVQRGLLRPIPRVEVDAAQDAVAQGDAAIRQNPQAPRGNPTGEVRAGLGITAVTVTPTLFAQQRLSVRQGALVEVVEKGSAAEKAGLKVGAVVIAVDGRKIDSAISLSEVVQMYQPRQTAQVMFYEGNRLKRLVVKFDAIPVSELSELDQFGNLQPNQRRNGSGIARSPNRNGSILGPLADEFPRLKRIDEMMERFSPEQNRQNRDSSAEYKRSGSNPNREATLKNEVQTLRGRVLGQDQQIKALTDKLNAMEKLLGKSKK